jgi:hypothetical protein
MSGGFSLKSACKQTKWDNHTPTYRLSGKKYKLVKDWLRTDIGEYFFRRHALLILRLFFPVLPAFLQGNYSSEDL